MLRLAVSGVPEADRLEAASRLRSAVLEALANLGQPALGAFDGIVFRGSDPPDSVLIEQWLHAGKHVLLATETCLPMDALDRLVGLGQQANVRFAVVNPDH